MEHETIGRIPLLISLFKGTHDQIDIRLPGDMPGDDFPGKQVDHNAEVVPLAACFDIREIADPNEIGSILRELLMQMIRAFALLTGRVLSPGLAGGHRRKVHAFHQAVHSSDTDMDAIITSEDVSDFIGAKPLIIISIDMEDRRFDLLILNRSGSRFGVEMLVIRAPIHPQDSAQSLDIMLKTQLMDSV